MLLKQGGKTIKLAIKKKNLFILNIQILGKTMLVKERRKPTKFFSKNPQIKFWHRRLGHISNAKIVGASKLTDSINISEEDHIEEEFSSNFEKDNERENLELPTTMLIVASASRDDSDNCEKTYVE